jgi:hypothetical protein
MSGFQVGVGALTAPARRLKQISADLDSARSGAGVTAVLAALGDDAGLLADKVQQAGVTYEAVDRRAVPAR